MSHSTEPTRLALLLAACVLSLAGPHAAAKDDLPPGAILRIGSPRFRMAGEVIDARFARDGKTVVSLTREDAAVWQYPSGRRVRTMRLDGRRLVQGSLAPGGGLTAMIDRDFETVTVWDISEARPRVAMKIKARGWPEAVAFSPDNRLLALGYDEGFVQVWRVPSGQLASKFRVNDKDIKYVVFSPDSRWLYAADDYGDIDVWSRAAGKTVRRIEAPASIEPLAVSADGKRLAGACGEYVYVWDIATGKIAKRLPAMKWLTDSLAFTAGGKQLVAVNHEKLRVWNLSDGKTLRDAYTTAGRIGDVSPDGRSVAMLGSGSLLFRDAESLKSIHGDSGHSGGVGGMAYSCDGKMLATVSRWEVRIWSPVDGRLVQAWSCPDKKFLSAPAFSPDARLLAVGSGEGRAWILDPTSRQKPRKLQCKSDAWITGVAFGDGGKVLAATGWHQNVEIWDCKTWQRRTVVEGLWQQMSGTLTFDATRPTRLLWTSDKAVRLFDMATKRVTSRLTARSLKHETWASSPDCKLLAAADRPWESTKQYVVYVYDLDRDALNLTIKPPHKGTLWLGNLVMDPTGRVLAITEYKPLRVRFWDVSTGKQLATLPELAEGYGKMAFSPDGKHLATSGSGTILIWDLRKILPARPASRPAETDKTAKGDTK